MGIKGVKASDRIRFYFFFSAKIVQAIKEGLSFQEAAVLVV